MGPEGQRGLVVRELVLPTTDTESFTHAIRPYVYFLTGIAPESPIGPPEIA